MSQEKFLKISWQLLERDSFDLAQAIIESNLKLDRIIAISRGGLVIGRLMSDFLNLPISTIAMQQLASENQSGEPVIAEKLTCDVNGQNLLLVDEIVDHGEVLAKVTEYLAKLSGQRVYSLVPYIKPWAKPKPDFYLRETEKWVIFPYDIREMTSDLVGVFKKKGISPEQIKNQLLALGFSQTLTEYFLKKEIAASKTTPPQTRPSPSTNQPTQEQNEIPKPPVDSSATNFNKQSAD
ncbi:MAG: hypothetical protein JW991_05265 [Candidatus Pacebacteria bacterium]|nr:hypothetical protein [Candidatus Paceibacterota bacterium]